MVLAEPDTLLPLVVRSAILVAALLAFAVGFRRWRRQSVESSTRLMTRQLEMLDVLESLAAAQAHQARQLQGRLEQLEQRFDLRLGQVQQRFDSRLQTAGAAASQAPRGYELALRLARAGTGEEEIASASGVTRQEAQLLVRLHGPRQSA